MLVVVASIFGPVPLLAQESAASNAAAQQNQAEGSAVARWQADKTTIFSADEVVLEDFKWIARPLIVFGQSPVQPAFIEQMEYIADRIDDLARRDVIVISDSDPASKTAIREKFRPRDFQLTLVGKDGAIKLRKPFPWHVREIGRSIDKMPIRQREIREGR
ncbi:DUF4174 domain-containing protein [Palleronia caenipelagi]|uniref:DUF4174 domain-containing protein n=2 Tax=Palleronia caenipelagi TaxID=2489174 RepID=A0A547PRE3_9RHOB|nr:DUF4174 domain-containing protein [Palleronia caenipelagi]